MSDLAKIRDAALEYEAATHTYILGGRLVPSVTQVLTDNGLRTDFAAVSLQTLETARQRGTAVHAATHYLDERDLDRTTLDPTIAPYVAAWEQFKAERGVDILALEHRVASATYQVAGQIDRIARVRGILGAGILDIKTGSSDGANYQTAGYALLAGGLPWFDRGYVAFRWAVSLHPGESVPYRVHEYRDRTDFDVFRAAVLMTHTRAKRGISWRHP